LRALRCCIAARQDTSGDNFRIELDGQALDNRGIAGELLIRRAEKLRSRIGEDVRLGRFAGFDLFIRPGLNETTELTLRGRNCYGARITETAHGTIRSLESTVQGFEERATKLESDVADTLKRAKELEGKVGAPFEHEERHHSLTERQQQIAERLDLTRNQAPSASDSEVAETQKASDLDMVISSSQHDEEGTKRQTKHCGRVRV